MGHRGEPLIPADLASLLLDASAVLAFAQDRPEVRRWLEHAKKVGIDPLVSYVTVAETFRARPAGARVRWVLSRLDPVRITLGDCKAAGRLLSMPITPGTTLDALVAATALRLPKPVVVLTSDTKDLGRLLQDERRVLVARV